MAPARTFIRTFDGGQTSRFSPSRMLKANQRYVQKNPDPNRLFVHVEGEDGGSEWRPLELFSRKPPLGLIELYASNRESSKLSRSDPRVVAALAREGVTDDRVGRAADEDPVSKPSANASGPATSVTSSEASVGAASALPSIPDNVLDVMLQQGTEEQALVRRRRGQNVLRRYLLGDAHDATCAICGSTLPVGYLVAAHILPWSACAEHERLDLNNLALMCVFGCDALFERGAVSVEGETVVPGPVSIHSSALAARIGALVGRKVVGLAPGATDYIQRKRLHVSRSSEDT